MVKDPPASTGDSRDEGSIPGSGRSPGLGNGTPLQYPCLENSMGREAWWATVHGATKSHIQLSTHTHTHTPGGENNIEIFAVLLNDKFITSPLI